MPEARTELFSAANAATGTDGAMLVGRGPGEVPLLDPNNYWNPSLRQRKLVGHAVSSGGDRWNLQDDSGNDLHCVDKYGTMAGRATGANVVLSATVASVSLTNNAATINTTAPHKFRPADWAVVNVATTTALNGTFIVVTTPTPTSFTYTLTHADISPTSESGSAVVTRKASVQEYQTSTGGQCSRFDASGALIFERDLTEYPTRYGDSASLVFRQSFNGSTVGHVAVAFYDRAFLFNETTTKTNLSLQTYFLDDGSYYSGRSLIVSQDRNKLTGQIAQMGGQTMIGASCDINAPAFKAQNQLNLVGEKFRYCYGAYDAADIDPNYPAGGEYSDRGFGKNTWLVGPRGETLWGNYLNPNRDDSDPEQHRLAKLWLNPATSHLTVEGTGLSGTTSFLDLYGPPNGNSVLRLGSRGTQGVMFLGTAASSTGIGQIGLGGTSFINMYNNPVGVTGVGIAIGVDDATSALTVDAAPSNVGITVITARAKNGQIGDIFRAQDYQLDALWRVNKAGYPITKKNAAPADADLEANECAYWFDSSNGAAKVMFKGKSANGAVVAGSVLLA